MKLFKGYWLFSFFTLVSIGILALILYYNRFAFYFNENTGLYLFSSLIQSNAAIISIFSVFYIFRLQSLQSSISEIYNSLSSINSTIKDAAREFRRLSLEKKKAKIDSYSEDIEIEIEYKKWYDYEISIITIKSVIKKPTIIIITVISLQILFLIFANEIHLVGPIHEFISFIIIAVFQVYILILLYKTILLIVK